MTDNRCTKVLRERLDYINSRPRPTTGLQAEAAALRWAINRLAEEAANKENDNGSST
jgi:hypothetical protein